MQAAVIGLGNFGRAIAETLIAGRHEVVIVDQDEELVQRFEDRAHEALIGDATNDKLLETIGPAHLDVVVVGIGDDVEASVLTCMTLLDLGAKFVVAKAEDTKHAQILERIGVHKVVFPERESARHVADLISHPNLVEKIDIGDTHAVLEVAAPPSFHDKTLVELNLRSTYNLLVLGIRRWPHGRSGKSVFVAPPRPEEQLRPGDVLTIMCPHDSIRAIEKWK